jgi:hypothetical protein
MQKSEGELFDETFGLNAGQLAEQILRLQQLIENHPDSSQVQVYQEKLDLYSARLAALRTLNTMAKPQ